jgi:hypothetical protein
VRKLPFFAIFLILFFSLKSEGRVVSFGLKGGINLTNIRVTPAYPDLPQLKSMAGFNGGVFISINLGQLAIQPEFFYARRGTKFDQIIDGLPYKVEYRLDYFEGILFLKWKILSSGLVRPVIFAGPSFGYLNRAKAVLFDSSNSYVESVDIKDFFKKNEWAAVFGAGIELKFPFLLLSLESRYHLGLSNIAALADGEVMKNKGLAIIMGVAF